MKTKIVLLLLFICNLSYPQELKTKIKKDGVFKEIYTTNNKDKKRQGIYVKMYRNSSDTLIKGLYDQDKMIGLWSYYKKNNEKYFQYNYDYNKIEYLDDTIAKIDTFFIKEGNNFVLSKISFPPIYIGFEGELRKIIENNLEPTPQLLVDKKSGLTIASFVIDKNGIIKDITIEKSIDDAFNNKLVNSINLIKGKWIPAKKENIPIDSKIYVVIETIFSDASRTKCNFCLQEKPYKWVIYFVISA